MITCKRKSCAAAAKPEDGRRLYDDFVTHARRLQPHMQTGEFGADAQVHGVNNGSVTTALRLAPTV
jgi:D-aminoacyl-tRNA deacylase